MQTLGPGARRGRRGAREQALRHGLGADEVVWPQRNRSVGKDRGGRAGVRGYSSAAAEWLDGVAWGGTAWAGPATRAGKGSSRAASRRARDVPVEDLAAVGASSTGRPGRRRCHGQAAWAPMRTGAAQPRRDRGRYLRVTFAVPEGGPC